LRALEHRMFHRSILHRILMIQYNANLHYGAEERKQDNAIIKSSNRMTLRSFLLFDVRLAKVVALSTDTRKPSHP
jgi:hypothetical protein